MEIIGGIFGILFIALFLFQLYVLFRIVTAPFYSGAQKLVQFLLVILLPVLGVFLAWWVWRSTSQEVAPNDPHFEPDRRDGEVTIPRGPLED